MSQPVTQQKSFFLPGLTAETRRRFDLTMAALKARSDKGELSDTATYAVHDMAFRMALLSRFMREEVGVSDPQFDRSIETTTDFIVLVSTPKSKGA